MMNGSKPYGLSGGDRSPDPMRTVYVLRALASPSPRPSPLGRGRIAARLSSNSARFDLPKHREPFPLSLRACLKIGFGVPPLGGTAPEPPKGGTPNLRLRIPVGFLRHALRGRAGVWGNRTQLDPAGRTITGTVNLWESPRQSRGLPDRPSEAATTRPVSPRKPS